MDKVECCECGRKAKRAIRVARLQGGTVQRVCLPCWNRLAYDAHFSDQFKARAMAELAPR